MSESYGPLVRLWGIHPSKLPPAGAKTEDLKVLLGSILLEALPFISSVPSEGPSADDTTELRSPTELWKHKSTKTFDGSTAPVHLFERTVDSETLDALAQTHSSLGIKAGNIQSETWALRRSTHVGKKEEGTADWDEFLRCFKEEHAEAETAFTPSVLSSSRLQEWDCEGIEVEVEGTTWTDWTLRREEAVHQLPGPLTRRVFPVLQATTSLKGQREFLVVQIAMQAGDDADESSHKGTVPAAYTSIERVRELADGRIEWVMGTASDARGLVPMWVQKLGLAGQIAKDVGMFLRWIAKERKKGKDAQVIGDLE
ncbi:hypothetical protein NW754_012795 [Fusarium falciforme]|uniref:DUF3074 domain-containing protein n=1 Tax=Fusarium falciforme TaxID=195108 RepID=A0A9W8RHZ6_9HYPO|nr:hypothetical protein NW754_012795 [Fusarium falciforme]KAJ4196777.1 hypothetical protein NW755_001548 [Fusarium falciforme]KAJ4207853.1 hypothetical protein NW767_002088 [Fusarium falciforme]KAJ4259184.1 hypothetical protein NW757_002513 [Fusarium falciforme]